MIGNQNGTEEVEARGKGNIVTISRKGRALHGAEESIAWQRSNKETGRLWRGFYRGTGFCRVMGS